MEDNQTPKVANENGVLTPQEVAAIYRFSEEAKGTTIPYRHEKQIIRDEPPVISDPEFIPCELNVAYDLAQLFKEDFKASLSQSLTDIPGQIIGGTSVATPRVDGYVNVDDYIDMLKGDNE